MAQFSVYKLNPDGTVKDWLYDSITLHDVGEPEGVLERLDRHWKKDGDLFLIFKKGHSNRGNQVLFRWEDPVRTGRAVPVSVNL